MQIHEITLQRRVDEALGSAGSFFSGLTGGMSDKYMDKTPGAGKVQNTSEKWQDRYATLSKDPAVISYVKTFATDWIKNSTNLVKPTQGLTSTATLQKTIPTLVSAAKKSNNQLTSAQIGQILAKSAPTIWKNTPDRPDPATPNQTDKAAAIKQLADELRKQGVTVDSPTPPPDGPGAAAFDQMAKQLTTGTNASSDGNKNQTTTTSAGGKLQPTPTGLIHTGKPAAATAQTTAAPAATTKVRATYPKALAPGTIAEPPVFLSGKKLDPKKPGDAKTLAAIKAQGKLNEAATIGPAADQYKAAFVQWSDGQLATRVPETGETVTMNAVRQQFPNDLANALEKALNQIIATQGTPQQAPAVQEYAKLAVAGIQAVAQMSKNKISAMDRQQNTQFATTAGAVKQSLRDSGIDPDRLAQFGAQAKEDGSPMAIKRTGDTTADTLLKLAGFALR